MHPIIAKRLAKGGPGSGRSSTGTNSNHHREISVPVSDEHTQKGYSATIQFGKTPKEQHNIIHNLYHQGNHVAQGSSHILGDGKLKNIKAASPDHKKVLLHTYEHYTQ